MVPIERLRARLPAAIVAGQAAVGVACAVDLVTARGAAPPVLATVVVALGLGLGVGALGGAAAALASLAWPRRPAWPTVVAAGFAAALWIVGHGALIPLVARRFHDPKLMAALLVGAGAVLLAPSAFAFVLARRGLRRLARLGERVRWRPPGGAILAAAAVLVLVVAIAAPVLHVVVVGAAGGLAAAGALALWQRAPRLRVPIVAGWAVVSVGALALALGPPGDDPGVQRGEVVPATVGVVRPLLDRDGDGAIGMLGDGDCAEGDPARGPHAIEILDDGIDQDCRYGDLHARPPLPLAESAAAGRIVLLSLGGLDERDLPKLAARLDAGLRFSHHRGLDGPFIRTAAAFLAGRPRDELPVDGASLPALAGAAGWSVAVASTVDLSDETSVFPTNRAKYKKDPQKLLARARALLARDRSFLWIHLGVGKKPKAKALDKLDATLEQLLGSVANAPYRVLVVGDRGPLGLLGGETGVLDEPVSTDDVYPTLLALIGLTEPPIWAAHQPATGRALVGALAPAPDPRQLAGEALYRRNVDRAAGLVDEAPADLIGNPATIAGALDILGCARRELSPDRLEITLYLRGGEHLAAGDRVEVMVKSPGVRLLAVAAPPLRFGDWPDGATVAHRLTFDRHLLGADDPMVWATVQRRGKRLPVTAGEGASQNIVPICVVSP